MFLGGGGGGWITRQNRKFFFSGLLHTFPLFTKNASQFSWKSILLKENVLVLERFMVEWRKTKTKLITTANQMKGDHNELPMRSQRANSLKRGKKWVYKSRLISFWFWLVEKVARVFLNQSYGEVKRSQSNPDFFRHSIENCPDTNQNRLLSLITPLLRIKIDFISTPIRNKIDFYLLSQHV